jgi:hypothetical protein
MALQATHLADPGPTALPAACLGLCPQLFGLLEDLRVPSCSGVSEKLDA